MQPWRLILNAHDDWVWNFHLPEGYSGRWHWRLPAWITIDPKGYAEGEKNMTWGSEFPGQPIARAVV